MLGGKENMEKGDGGVLRLDWFSPLIKRELFVERLLGRTGHLACIYVI